MDGSGFPPPARGRSGRFLAGNAGRAFGSRNRERLARAILRDCEGELDELPPRMRRCFLPQHIGLVARLAPKVNEVGGVDLDGSDEAALASGLCDVRAALDKAERGEATFEDLEAAMLGRDRHDQGAVINGRFGVYGRGALQGRRAVMPAGRVAVEAPLFAGALR